MIKNLTALAFLFISFCAFAQKNPIERIWNNQEKSSKIQIFKGTDGKYYGKIVWLSKQNDAKGKLRTDIHHPNETHRNQPLLNLVILKGFTRSSTDINLYEEGSIYDPNNGKTYCGKLTLKGDKINLRGFICGFSILGRSSIWTLAE